MSMINIIQLIKRTLHQFLMAVIFALFLTACTSNEPLASAKIWLKATLIGEYQTAINLTCNLKIEEIKNILASNKASGITSVDISNIEFKTIDEGNNIATVEARGQVLVQANGNMIAPEIYYRWRFIYEANEWKWCGDAPNAPSNNIPIIAGALTILLIIFALAAQRRKGTDFSQFISPSEESDGDNERLLNKLVNYESGEVKSFNKRTGEGVVETDNGERYIINQRSIIGKGDKTINTGEDILFQKNWETNERRAKNIIKVQNESKELSPYSTWLIHLAHKTKRLRISFRFWKLHYVQSELNTCKAFLEQLNDYANKYDVKIAPYEIVLTNVIERDLNNISKKVNSLQTKSSLWSGVLSFIIHMLGILADFIQVASPGTALLLKSISKGIKHLLGGPKDPPSLND